MRKESDIDIQMKMRKYSGAWTRSSIPVTMQIHFTMTTLESDELYMAETQRGDQNQS